MLSWKQTDHDCSRNSNFGNFHIKMRSKKATLQFVPNFLLKSFLKQYFGSRSAKKNRVRTLCGLRHSKSLHFVYFVLEVLGISRRHIFTQLSLKTLVDVTPDISTNVRECNLLDNLVNYIILAKTIDKMARSLSQEILFVAFAYRVT